LECVKRHKAETDCDGLRDKVKFLSMGQFSDMDVVNDFRLLEEVTKQVDKCKRDKLKRCTRQGDEMMIAPRLSKHLQRLQSQARSRGCRVRILPPHFVRRKNNTSKYDFKEKVIKWHVELKFINIDQTVTLPSVSERTKLWKLLSDFVEFESADNHEDPFQQYRAVSYGGISLYLKAEGQAAPGETDRRFYPLDMKRSLKTMLKNTRIVEHPIIHVIFSRDEHLYREDQDYVLFDEEKETVNVAADDGDNPDGVKPRLGDVLSQADAMQADPESYKQYFDFYLKYYTSKYAQQGVDLNNPETLPNPMAQPPQPAQYPNTSSNTFPNRAQFLNNTFPQRSPYNSNTNYNLPNASKYPNRSAPNRNFSYNSQQQSGTKFSPAPRSAHQFQPANTNGNKEVNRENIESAKKIKDDLKKNFVNPIGGLVAYDDSDSD